MTAEDKTALKAFSMMQEHGKQWYPFSDDYNLKIQAIIFRDYPDYVDNLTHLSRFVPKTYPADPGERIAAMLWD